MAAGTMRSDPRWGDVLVDEAVDAPGRARLAREAVALDRARHPGVAELLDHADDGERATLVVRPHGRRTVADMPGLAADQVAAVGAAVAQTLADLHRGGISHGSLGADRIHLTGAGQPVLVGFADAGLADPPSGQGGNFDPGGDVEALADLLEQVLDPAEATHRRGAALLTVLHRAAGSSMEELAGALAELAGPVQPPLREEGDPFADLGWFGDATREFWPSPAASRPPVERPAGRFVDRLSGRFGARSGGRIVWLGLLALVALLAGAGVVVASGGSGPATAAAGAPREEPPSTAVDPPDAPAGSGAAGDPPPAATTSSTTTATPKTAAALCPTSYDEAASVGIPASCALAASAHGNTVQVGPLSWLIGDDQAVAALGDFDCDGWLEVVALAPGSAQVVAFDGWAGAGQEPSGRLVRVVPGATGLDVRQDGPCHHLVVTGPPAGPVDVDPTARP